MARLLAILIAAHLLADFALQTDEMVRRKRRMHWTVLHALVHAVTTYLAIQAWFCWELPAAVLLLHFGIDFIKQRRADTPVVFAADQTAHIITLLGLAWVLNWLGLLSSFTGVGYRAIVGVAGFVATVKGAGCLIARVATHLKERNNLELDGLVDGGRLIGELERALIFVLVFIGQPGGIGFLVAAKSILRFEEAKKQKLAEYVLVGTLLSFTLAIVLAVTTQWAMQQ